MPQPSSSERPSPLDTTPDCPPPKDDVLTTEEAARLLKVSTKTLRKLVRLGQVKARRYGVNGQILRFIRRELLAPQPTDKSVSVKIAFPPLSAAAASPAPKPRTLQRINGVVRYR